MTKRKPVPAYYQVNRRRLVIAFLDREAKEQLRAVLHAAVAHDTLALRDLPKGASLGKLTGVLGFDGGRYLGQQLKRRVQSNLALLEAFD